MRSPLLPGNYADPDIVRFGDTYYIYATTDGTPGWEARTSTSGSRPTSSTGSAASRCSRSGSDGDVPWATGNAWAPTIIERDGKYYFYFSAPPTTQDDRGGRRGQPGGAVRGQPTAMIHNNEAVSQGRRSTRRRCRTRGPARLPVLGQRLAGLCRLAEPTCGPSSSRQAAINGLTNFREGAFVNVRDGVYYLTYSIDDTGSPDYRVGYATATSIDGPWTYRGLILEKDTSQGILATGHSSIVQVPGTDDWYIAYHRFAIPGGNGTNRETTIDRLHFNADGTIKKVVPTLTSIDPLTYEGTPPVAWVSDAGSEGWYGADAALTLTGDATIERLEYRLPDGGWTAYVGPVDLPAGSYDVRYRAQGTNLQWSEVRTLPVKVDDTAPEVSWRGVLTDGASYVFGSVPDPATCAATDAGSGPDECTVAGFSTLVGTHTLTATATDVAGNETSARITYTVTPWRIAGFYSPVDMNGVYNTVKAGSTVPLKFEVFAGDTELTATADVRGLTAREIACDTAAPRDAVELITSGRTELTYADGVFQHNWKTPRAARTCIEVTVETRDGSEVSARFLLR